MGYKVAVVGATGAVGEQMLAILHQRNFPVSDVAALASSRSAGSLVNFGNQKVKVEVLNSDSFSNVKIALFSAGGNVSREFALIAAKKGAWVIDNTSAFRMDPDIPLVVPEVNSQALSKTNSKIIANPNCSTIQMVVALNPIRKAAGLKRIVVSTYQAVAGAGRRAMDELAEQVKAWANEKNIPIPQKFPHQILFECLPQIGDFDENGDSVEELKMINETRKIFDLPNLPITATTVRVPVMVGHSESVNVEMQKPLNAEKARQLLANAPGICLIDEPKVGKYPLAQIAQGKDPVYVGRIREDQSVTNGLNMWIVADNLRKGAALNAVQIAEILHDKNML